MNLFFEVFLANALIIIEDFTGIDYGEGGSKKEKKENSEKAYRITRVSLSYSEKIKK